MQDKNYNNDVAHLFQQLPGIDALLQCMTAEISTWGHDAVAKSLRDFLAQLRAEIAHGGTPDFSIESIRHNSIAALSALDVSSLVPVINLTGTVLHTNLGRAVLSQTALDAVITVAGSSSNLEFDLESGRRGERDSHVESLVCELTGAEAATVVNNNAAAVLLVLNTLALAREVPVSRGELVEIGGSFRIPEVMARAGCQLVEIGATNRTHLTDYRNAIGEKTALLMKVHTSNYQVEGFTHSVAEMELAALAAEYSLPLVVDMGSGNLVDFAALGLPGEVTAAETLAKGADIITFSGDKLLGGPQAGLIAGRHDLIDAIRKNPLKRALRVDKMTLAALAETLKLYRDPNDLLKSLPTLRYLTRDEADIRAQGERLLPRIKEAIGPSYSVTVDRCLSQVGSGSLPVDLLESAALQCRPTSRADESLRHLQQSLRNPPAPVVGRLHKGSLWLDLRCLEVKDEDALIGQLQHAAR
jgi:L-seryl-tRNA(Ser) seleniumtransferase